MRGDLRYVVLHHEGYGEPHYDLMFERAPGSALWTFRSPEWPMIDGVSLEPLGDHRREYLEYEGELTGDRGSVRRVEAGTYWIKQRDEVHHFIEMRLHRGPFGVFLRVLMLKELPQGKWKGTQDSA